jgi:S1-C subfamily serine protease
MSLRAALFGVAVVLFTCTNAFAHKNPPADVHDASLGALEVEDQYSAASRFTVKVLTKLAHVFHFDPEDSTGSGFIYEIRKNDKGEEVGVVFTNKHVVDSKVDNVVREIKLEFQTDTIIPESIPAKVIFESHYEDFAAIEFKLSDLKRVKKHIRPALTPQPGSPYLDYAKNYRKVFHGLVVAAQGSPLEADLAMTEGIITSFARDDKNGDLIQTQTPINPGNSGGPLVVYTDRQFGEVIGLSVSKDVSTGVDNVGYAIPIGAVIEEYRAWRENPAKLESVRRTAIYWMSMTEEELDILPAKQVIAKAYPRFFLLNKSALKIEDADPKTNLQTGDIVVTVNGEMASTTYEFNRALAFADGPIRTEVVRGNKIVAVDVQYEDLTENEKYRRSEFLIFSGMLFRENVSNYFTSTEPTTAVFERPVNSSHLPMNMIDVPPPETLIVGAHVDGRDYTIKKLSDLQAVLEENRGAEYIRLDVREPLEVRGSKGMTALVMDAFNQPYHAHHTSTYLIPIMDIILPSQFSIENFVDQVRFDASNRKTQVWRNCVTELTAEKPAKKKKPRSS